MKKTSRRKHQHKSPELTEAKSKLSAGLRETPSNHPSSFFLKKKPQKPNKNHLQLPLPCFFVLPRGVCHGPALAAAVLRGRVERRAARGGGGGGAGELAAGLGECRGGLPELQGAAEGSNGLFFLREKEGGLQGFEGHFFGVKVSNVNQFQVKSFSFGASIEGFKFQVFQGPKLFGFPRGLIKGLKTYDRW